MELAHVVIRFSRHAKRRITLYRIQQIDIENSIEKHMKSEKLIFGRHEFIDEGLKEKYRLPVKIVIDIGKDLITVITAYPLKKGII
ncbi:MAG: hypothetical protein QME58_05755 [Bacteroidota bacterium]|nr:hypothetical protein [Bacteroidota bacterium]